MAGPEPFVKSSNARGRTSDAAASGSSSTASQYRPVTRANKYCSPLASGEIVIQGHIGRRKDSQLLTKRHGPLPLRRAGKIQSAGPTVIIVDLSGLQVFPLDSLATKRTGFRP